MTALSDFLTDQRQGRNIDQRVEAARAAGHEINRATVYSALRGRHAKQPTEDVLQALAFVFEVKVTDLRPLVNRPAGELGPWTPTGEAHQLDRDQRNALDALIKTIVRKGEGHAGSAATKEPGSGPAAPNLTIVEDVGGDADDDNLLNDIASYDPENDE